MVGRGVVFVEVRAGHLGVDAREGRPGEPLPLGLPADAEPVLGRFGAEVGHHLDAACEDDIGHPAPDRLDPLPDHVPGGGTGVLDSRGGDAVETDGSVTADPDRPNWRPPTPRLPTMASSMADG